MIESVMSFAIAKVIDYTKGHVLATKMHNVQHSDSELIHYEAFEGIGI